MESRLYAGFNPLIITDIEGLLSTAYIVINGDEANKITLKTEMLNGEAKVDIAKYVRHYFVQEHLDNTFLLNSKLFELKWELRDRDNIRREHGRLINAVVQVGENPDLSLQQGTFRTSFKRLRKYVGYELSVGCIGYEGYDSTPNGSTVFGIMQRGSTGYTTYAPTPITRYHFLFHFSTHFKDISRLTIASNQNGVGKIWLPIDNYSCTPNNPFYVRWVNQMGGYDYWMFSGQQRYESKIENRKIFNPYFADVANINKTREIYNMECRENVVVGAENVNEEDFLPLRKLVYSPLIEWWDERRSKWMRLFVSDFDSAYNTQKSSHKIEVTFELPDIQLQF